MKHTNKIFNTLYRNVSIECIHTYTHATYQKHSSVAVKCKKRNETQKCIYNKEKVASDDLPPPTISFVRFLSASVSEAWRYSHFGYSRQTLKTTNWPIELNLNALRLPSAECWWKRPIHAMVRTTAIEEKHPKWKRPASKTTINSTKGKSHHFYRLRFLCCTAQHSAFNS